MKTTPVCFWIVIANKSADWRSSLFTGERHAYLFAKSVEELESVVSGLSPAELTRFSRWFEEFVADEWDRQIERDRQAGRLDAALKRADDHYEAGRCTLVP